jgi:hypothetical protein
MNMIKRVIPKSAKRFIRKWIDKISFELKLRVATPVIVYQMGKVGSSSVYNSLLKRYAGVVLHAHSFSPDHEDPQIRRLYQWAISKSKPLNVVSLTREPIGTNVSSFFQNFEKFTGEPYANANLSLDELRGMFLSNYWHDIPLDWFDKNILANFGIDVFATPFPDKGISTYSHNNVRLLVMRLEIDDNEKIKAIGDFLGLADFQLRNTNIGEENEYAKTYKSFRNSVKLPPDYIARMCESKYFNHFYNKETIEAAKKRWSES